MQESSLKFPLGPPPRQTLKEEELMEIPDGDLRAEKTEMPMGSLGS